MVRSSFWTPTSSQGLVHGSRKLRLPNTVYLFHRVYSAQISACVIAPAWCKDVCRRKAQFSPFGNPAQLSAGRNPRTVQKQRSLAPRMRRYLADRQWRSFLRIPSGHAPVTWCDSSLSIRRGASCRWAYRVGDFNFKGYPSADSERLQSP